MQGQGRWASWLPGAQPMSRPPNVKGCARLANLDLMPPLPFRIIGGGGHPPELITLGVALREVDESAWTSRGVIMKQSQELMDKAPWFSLAPQDDLMEWIEILDMMGIQNREKELLRELCLLNGIWGYMEAYRIIAHLVKDSRRSIRSPSRWASGVIEDSWLAIENPTDWEGHRQRYRERHEEFPHWSSGTSWGAR